MASVERKRKIQIKHPKFSDQPGCVQLKKSGFASNNEMHAYRPLGQEYTKNFKLMRFLNINVNNMLTYWQI